MGHRDYFSKVYILHSVTTHLAGRPHYLSFLKPNYSWPVIHLIFFLFSTRGITHFFTNTQNITERVEEKNKRTNTDLRQLHKSVTNSFLLHRGRSLWRFCAALRAFVGYRGRVFARNFHKATRNAESSLDCPVLSTGLFCSLLLTVLFNPLLSTDSLCLLWDLPSLVHFRSRSRSRPQALCVGFALNRQKDSLTDTHTNRNECYPSCYTPPLLTLVIYSQ